MIGAVESRSLASRSRHSLADRTPVNRKTAEGAQLATHVEGRGAQPNFVSAGRNDDV